MLRYLTNQQSVNSSENISDEKFLKVPKQRKEYAYFKQQEKVIRFCLDGYCCSFGFFGQYPSVAQTFGQIAFVVKDSRNDTVTKES